ncbi:MAG: glutamate-1-semialdehyde 2,1-aminomutase, partial [Spirochaetes bacterium]|nr:glutamate-1-semialdehyde 2,1-aminomutase [Spirochaetota bacterium]
MTGSEMQFSERLFEEAKNYIPGGVNSPVRAFKSVDMDPIYIRRGKGSKLFDVDGNEYIDYVCSWGPLIFGHSDRRILKKISEFAENGTSFGANTEIEIKLAKLITEIYPSIDLVRMVNSGTEAAMSAIRLSRGFTGKNKIVKFEGCYHGHGDSFLIKAGSGVLTLGIPGSPGVTESTAQDTLIAVFNSIESVEKLIDGNKNQIAAVILEPVMGNAGVIPPDAGFLKKLREATRSENIILIFDEVITGFRVAPGGAQELYDIEPDLTCLGKIIGGGLPVGAYGGRRKYMEYLAPVGPVYQAGTLSGNPLAMAAGYETVSILRAEKVHERLEEKAGLLEDGLRDNMKRLNLSYKINR